MPPIGKKEGWHGNTESNSEEGRPRLMTAFEGKEVAISKEQQKQVIELFHGEGNTFLCRPPIIN